VKARRDAWRAEQPALDVGRLVFIDETWASTNMARRYGRAPIGERLVDAVPYGHWQTTTLVAALRMDGLTAPMVIDGAMNGDLFVAYVEQVLGPTLRSGDVVVLDNLSSHKRSEVRTLLEGAGCRLVYLPPYSPDFNPIELAFAKLKALLRKVRQRTRDDLWDFLGQAMDAFAPDECENYFWHCGYYAT
jgi:transposase